MSSIIKVNTFQDANGNALFSSDGSGNITGNNLNKPAFEAYLSSNQLITDATHTKVQFDTEVYDTNNLFDNSTNYRFTISSGYEGKYFFYCSVDFDTTVYDLISLNMEFRVNGTAYARSKFNSDDTHFIDRINPTIQKVIDLSVGDYVEVWGYLNSGSSQPQFSADTKSTSFGGYRIGA